MARRTDGEKIDELEKLGAALLTRLDSLRQDVNRLESNDAESAKLVTDVKIIIAVLQRDITELQRQNDGLKKDQEQIQQKRWSLLPPIIGAVASGSISALIAYFISRR